MARKTKAEKEIERQIDAAFKKHSNNTQINIMDIAKIMDAGWEAATAGTSIDEAVAAAVAKYSVN